MEAMTIVTALAILAVLAALSCVADSLSRRIRDLGPDGAGDLPVTVVVVAENSAGALLENLPRVLAQDHPAGFEVIVAIAKDDDGRCADVAKSMGLKVVRVPDSALYMSRRRLAITLGIRAAGNGWILLTDSSCRPLTTRWVSSMAAKCVPGVDIVVGYCNYGRDATLFRRFFRLHSEYRNLFLASRGRAHGTWGNNVMLRKEAFLAGKGFQGSLKYARGEYDFLVNKYGGGGAIALGLSGDCSMEQAAPTDAQWLARNLAYMETRRHLSNRVRHGLGFNLDMLFLHLSLWLSLAAAVLAARAGDGVALGVSLAALLVPLAARVLSARRALRRFSLGMPPLLAVAFEVALPLRNARFLMRYGSSDKADFISHKS